MVATKREYQWKEIVLKLWQLGEKVEGGRKVSNLPEILQSLGLSPAIKRQLIRLGLLRIKTRNPDTYLVPEQQFRAYGFSVDSEEQQLPQLAREALLGEDMKQTSIGFFSRKVDLCPGTKTGTEKVALLIDWDNINIGLQEQKVNFSPLQAINLVRPLGDLAAAWVFTDTQGLERRDRVNLHTYGYEIIDCPRLFFGSNHSKDTVDPVIMNKVFWLINYCPEITTVVLATADHDFLPCLSLLKNHGKKVGLMTARRYLGTLLKEQADYVLVIAPESGEELNILEKSFGPHDFDYPDEAVHNFVLLMAYCVDRMERVIMINRTTVDFKTMMSLLLELEDFPAERVKPLVLEKILSFLRRKGVLKKIIKGRASKAYYRLCYSHPFYQWVRKQDL